MRTTYSSPRGASEGRAVQGPPFGPWTEERVRTGLAHYLRDKTFFPIGRQFLRAADLAGEGVARVAPSDPSIASERMPVKSSNASSEIRPSEGPVV
jgi:hypothetical protein